MGIFKKAARCKMLKRYTAYCLDRFHKYENNTFGIFVVIVLNILTSTKNTVINRVILE